MIVSSYTADRDVRTGEIDSAGTFNRFAAIAHIVLRILHLPGIAAIRAPNQNRSIRLLDVMPLLFPEPTERTADHYLTAIIPGPHAIVRRPTGELAGDIQHNLMTHLRLTRDTALGMQSQ